VIAQVCESSSPLSGEVEVDESYFGARRGRGKNGAEPVVKRSFSAYWNARGNLHRDCPGYLQKSATGRDPGPSISSISPTWTAWRA